MIMKNDHYLEFINKLLLDKFKISQELHLGPTWPKEHKLDEFPPIQIKFETQAIG